MSVGCGCGAGTYDEDGPSKQVGPRVPLTPQGQGYTFALSTPWLSVPRLPSTSAVMPLTSATNPVTFSRVRTP